MPTDCNVISYSQYRSYLRAADYNYINKPSDVMTTSVDLNQQVNIGRYMLEGVGNLKIEWNYGEKYNDGRLHWNGGAETWWSGEDWPKAIKFTFTLYDSQEILKEGRRFTHIVYLGN